MGKNRNLIDKKFDSEPVYGDTYIVQSYSHTIMILEQIFMVIVEKYQKKIAHISVCH